MKNMDKNSKKKEIRKEILKHRRSLTEEEIRSGSHAIAEKILSMEVYQKAEAVYLYIDCKGEASVREIYEAALRDDKRIAAPRVHGEDMTFYYIHSMEEDLEPGYFAIPEPKTSLPEATDETALLLVPGVGFDPECHRLGYGKGFYDRYLSAHPKHPTIALALDFQIKEEIPSDTFDMLPDLVVTPTKVYRHS